MSQRSLLDAHQQPCQRIRNKKRVCHKVSPLQFLGTDYTDYTDFFKRDDNRFTYISTINPCNLCNPCLIYILRSL